MRTLALLLTALAAPAVAADPVPAPAPPTPSEVADAQKALNDPATGATIATIATMTGALAKAMMDMPVGEMEAALAGRKATKADKKRTVRDSLGGPEEAARVEREVTNSGAQMQAMQKALAAALPGMIAAAGVMQQELEKATANLPQAGNVPR